MRRRTLVAMGTAAFAGLVGCSVDSENRGGKADSGPLNHSSKTIPLDKAEAVRVNLKMGAGELRVKGGSPNLMDADFSYSSTFGPPNVGYSNSGLRSQLSIEQTSGTQKLSGNSRYSWDLKLNNSKPMSLHVEFGAGEAQLDLGGLALRDVEVKMGVGQVKLDLRGKPEQSYNVTVEGGIGQAVINLPKDVAIVAEASGGIGAINAKGLHKRGDRYFNDAYDDHAKTTIRLTVHGGIGEIDLNAE